ncbi:uncharacterized protein KY384_001426 [Bacidia gigantensis]|uniref:uncharacterized protein n=1 Tax=Bacidia gigantensis TaxID=2732470 RepID=UPI001D04C7EF|nr:uncharacterized protein KY384_001426 [Bacidia gigantensis]KAG8533685.1 hypothetical protein KY384_001426 [Bacidia gigantensis]
MYASSPEDTVPDLHGRLAAARLKLHTLDSTRDDYQQQKDIADFDIGFLEKEIREIQRSTYDMLGPQEIAQYQQLAGQPWNGNNVHSHPTGRPQSSDASFPNSGYPTSHAFTNGLDGHFASDGLIRGTGYGVDMPGAWNDEPTEPRQALPESPQESNGWSTNITSMSSPDIDQALPRKRQKASHIFDEESNSEHHPTAPTTTNTSPANLDSYDYTEDMFQILGGNPKEMMAEMHEEHLLQEKRAELVRQDEALARAIQRQFDGDNHLESGNMMGNAFGSSKQSRFNGNSEFLELSSDPSSALDSSPNTNYVKREHPTYFHQPVKTELSPEAPDANSYRRGALPIASPQRVKTEDAGPSRSANAEFINLSSDPSSPMGSATGIGCDSNHPISLDSDPLFQDLLRNDTPHHTNEVIDLDDDSASGFAAFNGLAKHATHFGHTFYEDVQNLYNRAQAVVGMGGGSVYGNGINNAAQNVPFVDLSNGIGEFSFSPTAIANNAISRHGINPSDPEAYQSLVDRVNYVASDPTRTKAEIKALLENIRPDENLPPENREGTPEAMTYPLMEHQKLGLAWLRKMEEGEQKGGILADDMGLGKTIQALSLMVSRRSSNPLCKTTLIICPVALLKQWEREIRLKLKPGPEHSLKTFIFHGNTRLASWDTLRRSDVVLTTFGTLTSEYKRYEGIAMKKKANPNWRPTSKDDSLSLLSDASLWYRVIIDEAQCIKNKGTRAAKAAFALKAQTRFCMTGTPMMNSVDELFSLVHFVRIAPWKEWKYFSDNFSKPLKSNSPRAKKQAMEKLQVLLKAILMRRTKKSMIDGKPILRLPPRHTEAVQAEFSEDEQSFYQALENRTQLQFNKYLKAGTIGRHYSNILVLLLRLRQACCHPNLIKDFAEKAFDSELTGDQMAKLAKSLADDVVARLKEQTENDEVGLCPICMDVSENTTIFIPCGHNACSECFAKITDPTNAIAGGDFGERGNREAACPNCRGKIEVSKIIDHRTFKQVHMPQNESMLEELKEERNDSDASSDTSSDSEDDTDDDVDANGNLRDFIVADDEDGHEGVSFRKAQKRENPTKYKGKGKAKEKRPRKTLASLKKDSMKNAKAKRRYLRRLEKEWETSAKIEQSMDILRNLQSEADSENRPPEKTIIFSLFTSLLDLLEIPINREGWTYRRYDGSMKADERNRAVEDFTDKKDCKILLTSLKAGNSGLNLAAASQVIIFEPFWNPYIEEQAIDRAHRIGQQNPVYVHRIQVKGTVEDRILTLQEKKRDLIESALDENASQRISRLSTQDLAFLFDVPLVRD